MFQLDTNIVVAFLRGNKRVAERLAEVISDAAISSIVLVELNYGVRASSKPEHNQAKLTEFIGLISVIPFDIGCALEYGGIRHHLQRTGKLAGEADILIAATAKAHNAILVTHNRRHFEACDFLHLDDWLE